MSYPINLIAVVGPTGAGKTALGVRLAERFNGEIVGADSRQVYRYMDVGTGKPTPEERARAPHHLIDVVNPDEEFSVAHYQEMAGQAISEIDERGSLPILAGGTGHYVWALLEGLRLPQVPPNPELRRQLSAVAEKEGGVDRLFAQLAEDDPVAAQRIDRRNVRRVVRAIEVTRATGRPFSEVGRREPPPYRPVVLGLTCNREELYRRTDARIDDMIRLGWVDEVRRLMEERGYSMDLPALSGLGYREIGRHVRGEIGLPEAVERIKIETHRFVRHQYAWFRAGDSRIQWIDITQDPFPAAERAVRDSLALV